ncbi:hypothetical protein LCGC14_0897520 [marine sediment metagenome]|uniref:Uncharacterized protein n=1 Tax=marine sediment metagenome TaxID=412755 RepID=A0A0F9RGH6_9ZZZZ
MKKVECGNGMGCGKLMNERVPNSRDYLGRSWHDKCQEKALADEWRPIAAAAVAKAIAVRGG